LKKILLLAIIGVISIIVTTGFTIAETTYTKISYGMPTPAITTPAKTTPTIIPPSKAPVATSNIKSEEGEPATSIKVLIVTSEGKKTYHNFQNIQQWTLQQAHSDRTSPQLQLESVPSTDKAYLYDMIKRKFENDPKIPEIEVYLEATTKDNQKIVTAKYSGCMIDQYWLWTDTDEQQYRFLKSDNIEPREQFFLKCKGYFINPIK